MNRKTMLALVLCLAAAAFCVAAPAAVADPGWPGVGTPQVAHVGSDGSWWAGGGGWGEPSYDEYLAGTPIPERYSVSMYMEIVDPNKANLELLPQNLLNAVTVKSADGTILLSTTNAQSAQFWRPIKWWPAQAGWWRGWEAHVGQLPSGTYRVTWVQQLLVTVTTSFLDENGVWVPIVIKPFKDTSRFSFTVQ